MLLKAQIRLCCGSKLISTGSYWGLLKKGKAKKGAKACEEQGGVMLLAERTHVLNEEKKKLGLTETIWYWAGEAVCLRGSWQSNKGRQEKGMCGALGAWWAFFSFRAGPLKGQWCKSEPY